MSGWRTFLVIALGSIVLAPAAAAQQRVREGRPAAASATIRIVNGTGSLRVMGWNRDSVAVSGQVGDNGSFYLGGTPGAMKLGVEARGGSGRLVVSDLEVWVPRAARLWVKTAGGDIETDSLAGSVSVVTANGRVRVSGRLQAVEVESLDGNIEVAADAQTASVRAASGTVVVRGVVKELTAATVSGPLLVGMEGASGRVRLETVSGEIAYKGDLTPDGELDAESHNGNVELRLPPDRGATYDVNTYGGVVRNALTQDRPTAKGTLRFTVGSGGASITVRTFKGTVDLKRRGNERLRE